MTAHEGNKTDVITTLLISRKVRDRPVLKTPEIFWGWFAVNNVWWACMCFQRSSHPNITLREDSFKKSAINVSTGVFAAAILRMHVHFTHAL